MNFESIQVGDLIAIPVNGRYWGRKPAQRYAFVTVDKVTPTQIVARLDRIRRKDGYIIGSEFRHASLVTPELLQEHADIQSKIERFDHANNVLNQLRSKLERSMPLEEMEQIASLVEPFFKEQA